MRVRSSLVAAALAAVLGAAGAASGTSGVVRVQPSAPEVPSNLLRISIEFAAPPAEPVLPQISLAHADGTPVAEPFLQQELWSPNGRILTILLHPGRVKTGLVAHEELGPILAEGENVVLAFDGRPIRRWRVGPVNRNGPDPAGWKLAPVAAGSRQALVVALDAAIDGRDAGYLAVADSRHRRVAGQARLKDGEKTWAFTPDQPWRAGHYQLVVRATLEDAAGNRLGSHFETAVDAALEPASDAAIAFNVDAVTLSKYKFR
jgi:hypothetical protein